MSTTQEYSYFTSLNRMKSLSKLLFMSYSVYFLCGVAKLFCKLAKFFCFFLLTSTTSSLYAMHLTFQANYGLQYKNMYAASSNFDVHVSHFHFSCLTDFQCSNVIGKECCTQRNLITLQWQFLS